MKDDAQMTSLDRRRLLGGMAALTAAPFFGGQAQAQAAGCVVSTWGGDYQNLLEANVAKPLQAAQGIPVQWDIGLHGPRKAKLVAERRLPRGTLDVVFLQDSDMYEMSVLGTLETLDESKIPNIRNVTPALKHPYSIPHIYSGLVLVYNPDHLEPKSFGDMWSEKLAGKIGLLDPLFDRILCMATLAAGKPLASYEPGKDKLLELKKLKPRFYNSQETAVQALKSGEIWVLPTWLARGVQWQSAGVNVRNVVPSEGIIPITYEASFAKNAPNKDAAYAFLNAVLAPEGQAGFARGMGYAPSVANSGIDADLAGKISFTPEQQRTIKTVDAEYLSQNSQKLRQWWDREFLA